MRKRPYSTVSEEPHPTLKIGLTEEDVTDALSAIESTYSRPPHDPSVAVIDGYGVRLRVERGHLEASDGLGPERRVRRWPRAERTLQRVVVTARSGTVSLDALRWCRATDASVVVVDDEGIMLACSPPGVSDARLRRAQALAAGTGAGLDLARYLLGELLTGRSWLARTHLDRPEIGDALDDIRERLIDVHDIDELRMVEGVAADLWWSGWEQVALRFAARDRHRVPDAWTRWRGRTSILGGIRSPRHATHPLNALLSYGYRLTEVEATLAAQAVGLDVSLGVSHADRPGRASFVLDVMEGLRPTAEELVLDLARDRPFLKREFAELASGEVRLVAPLTHELAEILMPRLANEAGPLVEHAAKLFAAASPTAARATTPLTRASRRRAGEATWSSRRRGRSPRPETPVTRPRRPQRRCEGCGGPLTRGQRSWCPACWPTRRSEAAATGSAKARQALDDPAVRQRKGNAVSEGKRAARDARIRAAGWDPEDWERRIRPALRARRVTAVEICDATGLSLVSAYRALQGRQVPAPRHWLAVAAIAGVARNS
jgi:CRISPR-associated protein Cas1